MAIVSKVRSIKIEVDNDKGYPARVFVEYVRTVVENGVVIADLPVLIEPLPADDPKAKKALGDLASAATANLALYQNETQRLGVELNQHKDKIKHLTDKIKKYEPDFNGK